jgi:hypothetical protein
MLNNQSSRGQNGDLDWEAFISKLESLGDITVIGATVRCLVRE